MGCGGRTTRLHHVALGAREVEEVAAFYRDLLGLREVRRNDAADGRLRSIWLDLGGALLMVERTARPPRHVVGVGAGPFLVSLAVTEAELSDLEGVLAGAGFPVESRTAHTIYVRDPEGNRVGLSCYPVPQTSQ